MYSRESRFLLEMIQNAEDNSYDISRTVNEDPFIHFDLQRDRLIIDCNEDGFTTTNVQSICQVHKSSKIRNGTTRYIGEKGIGFKSVFKFASQVKIQSGPFCFRFDDEEEDGLGMLTPRNADFEVLPPLVRTRMTLTMIDPGSFAQRRQELVELPETLLLFLHKLSEVSIKVCKNDDNEAINTKHVYRFDSLTSTGSLVTTSQSGSRSQKFYIKESVQTNMPTHQDRSNITQAEIVLSFPVDQSNRPIEESQYSFAYLPMRKVGLYVSGGFFRTTPLCFTLLSRTSSKFSPTSSLKRTEKTSMISRGITVYVMGLPPTLSGLCKTFVLTIRYNMNGCDTCRMRIFSILSGLICCRPSSRGFNLCHFCRLGHKDA